MAILWLQEEEVHEDLQEDQEKDLLENLDEKPAEDQKDDLLENLDEDLVEKAQAVKPQDVHYLLKKKEKEN